MNEVISTPRLPTSPSPSIAFGRSIDKVEMVPSAGGDIQFPFQLTDVSTGGSAYINARYGTVQDVEPTNTATSIAVSSDGTWTIYVHITIDINGVMLTAELLAALTGQPADTDYDGYITIGTVVVASGLITTINQAATHSLRTAMCGRVVTSGVLTTRGVYEFWGF